MQPCRVTGAVAPPNSKTKQGSHASRAVWGAMVAAGDMECCCEKSPSPGTQAALALAKTSQTTTSVLNSMLTQNMLSRMCSLDSEWRGRARNLLLPPWSLQGEAAVVTVWAGWGWGVCATDSRADAPARSGKNRRGCSQCPKLLPSQPHSHLHAGYPGTLHRVPVAPQAPSVPVTYTAFTC